MNPVDNKYYLYRHIRLDKNEPFYIGIGTKKESFSSYKTEYRRAFDKKRYDRTVYWHNITNQAEYEVEILLESDNYRFIKEKEIEFIALYGRENLGLGPLVNLTDGGEGTNGYKMSKEDKLKLSLKRKEEFKNGIRNTNHFDVEIHQFSLEGVYIQTYKSISEAESILGINTSTIIRVAKGKQKTAGNFIWRYTKDIGYIPNLKRKDTRTFYQYDLEGNFIREWENRIDASSHLNVGVDSIKSVLYKINRTCGGYRWSFDYLGTKIEPYSDKICIRKKEIEMYTKEGQLLKVFSNVQKAVEYIKYIGNYCGIAKCLCGNNKSAYGYVWKYKL